TPWPAAQVPGRRRVSRRSLPLGITRRAWASVADGRFRFRPIVMQAIEICLGGRAEGDAARKGEHVAWTRVVTKRHQVVTGERAGGAVGQIVAEVAQIPGGRLDGECGVPRQVGPAAPGEWSALLRLVERRTVHVRDTERGVRLGLQPGALEA